MANQIANSLSQVYRMLVPLRDGQWRPLEVRKYVELRQVMDDAARGSAGPHRVLRLPVRTVAELGLNTDHWDHYLPRRIAEGTDCYIVAGDIAKAALINTLDLLAEGEVAFLTEKDMGRPSDLWSVPS